MIESQAGAARTLEFDTLSASRRPEAPPDAGAADCL